MTLNTVFACEPHPIVVSGLAKLIADTDDLRFLGAASTLPQAMSALTSEPAHVVLVDQLAGFRSVLQFIQELKLAVPSAHVVLWTNAMETVDSSRALQQGARGILQKTSPLETVLDCIRTVSVGNLWIEQSVSLQISGLYDRRNGPRLTPREREIVQLVCRGFRNRQISEQLGITPGTVKVHLMHIFEKTGAKDRFELAMAGRKLLGADWEDPPHVRSAGVGSE